MFLIIYLTLSLYHPFLSLQCSSLSCSVDNSCKVLQRWTSRNTLLQSSPSHSLTLPPLLPSLSLWPTLLHRYPICRSLGLSTLPLNRYCRTSLFHSFKWNWSTCVFTYCTISFIRFASCAVSLTLCVGTLRWCLRCWLRWFPVKRIHLIMSFCRFLIGYIIGLLKEPHKATRGSVDTAILII